LGHRPWSGVHDGLHLTNVRDEGEAELAIGRGAVVDIQPSANLCETVERIKEAVVDEALLATSSRASRSGPC
jgi:hypothetical protein